MNQQHLGIDILIYLNPHYNYIYLFAFPMREAFIELFQHFRRLLSLFFILFPQDDCMIAQRKGKLLTMRTPPQ